MELAGERVVLAPALPREAARLGRRIRRVLRSSVVRAGTVVAIVIVAVAVLAPWVAPVPPDEQNFELIESPPGPQAWLGTDRFGRDVLSRVNYQRDYPVTQSTILFIAVLFMTVNLAVDLLYGYLEPRIRYGS